MGIEREYGDLSETYIGTVLKYDIETRECYVYVPKLLPKLYESEYQDVTSITNQNSIALSSIDYNENITTSNTILAKAFNIDFAMPEVGSKVTITFIDSNPLFCYWFPFKIDKNLYNEIESEKYKKLFTLNINDKSINISDSDTLKINLPEFLQVISTTNNKTTTLDIQEISDMKISDIIETVNDLKNELKSTVGIVKNTLIDYINEYGTDLVDSDYVLHSSSFKDTAVGLIDVNDESASKVLMIKNILKSQIDNLYSLSYAYTQVTLASGYPSSGDIHDSIYDKYLNSGIKEIITNKYYTLYVNSTINKNEYLAYIKDMKNLSDDIVNNYLNLTPTVNLYGILGEYSFTDDIFTEDFMSETITELESVSSTFSPEYEEENKSYWYAGIFYDTDNVLPYSATDVLYKNTNMFVLYNYVGFNITEITISETEALYITPLVKIYNVATPTIVLSVYKESSSITITDQVISGYSDISELIGAEITITYTDTELVDHTHSYTVTSDDIIV